MSVKVCALHDPFATGGSEWRWLAQSDCGKYPPGRDMQAFRAALEIRIDGAHAGSCPTAVFYPVRALALGSAASPGDVPTSLSSAAVTS